jgi:hypothetical protein
MTVKVDHTTRLLLDRYWDLCDQRDAANAMAAPFQKELDETNAEIERLRLHAIELKGDVEACRDGPAWLSLKAEIGRIALAVRFTPPRGTYVE